MSPPTDRTYVAVCARQLREQIGTLLLATLAALAVALPWLAAVALGLESLAPILCALCGAPAWAGLVAVAARGALGEPVAPLGLLAAARRTYGPAFLLGAATGGFAWGFERALSAASRDETLLAAALPLAAAAFAILLAVDLHAFPLLWLVDLPPRQTVRVALGLAALAPGATAGLLGAGALALLALTWLGPGTLLATLPTLAVLMVNNTRQQLARVG